MSDFRFNQLKSLLSNDRIEFLREKAIKLHDEGFLTSDEEAGYEKNINILKNEITSMYEDGEIDKNTAAKIEANCKDLTDSSESIFALRSIERALRAYHRREAA